MLIGVYGVERRPGEHAELAAGRAAAAAEAARQRPADRKQRARSSASRSSPVTARCSRSASITSACRKLLHPGQREGAGDPRRATCRSARACFWATPCGRGCSIRANYQSTTVHLPPALATGNLDIVTDAMVREVDQAQGRQGRRRRLHRPQDRRRASRRRRASWCSPRARCESVRILLESPASRTRSGKVGKYIMDTVGASFGGQMPLLENLPPHNEDGADGGHMYAPWWLYKEQLAGKLGFARGYHIEFGGGRRMPEHGHGGRARVAQRRQLRPASSRRTRGATTARSSCFAGRGEMIPNEDSLLPSSIRT